MPKFEIEVTYTETMTGHFTVTAKDEERAGAKAEALLHEKVTCADDFERLIAEMVDVTGDYDIISIDQL